MIQTIRFKIQIVVEPDDDVFHGYCPDLPGVHVAGETVEDTFNLAKSATTEHLQVRLNKGWSIPIGVVDRIEQEKSIGQTLKEIIGNLSRSRSNVEKERRIEDIGLALAA